MLLLFTGEADVCVLVAEGAEFNQIKGTTITVVLDALRGSNFHSSLSLLRELSRGAVVPGLGAQWRLLLTSSARSKQASVECTLVWVPGVHVFKTCLKLFFLFVVCSFNSRLEARLTSDLLHEMEEFEGVYERFRRIGGWEGEEEEEEEEEGETFRDPGISSVGGDSLQLDGGSSLGGSVAMALEKTVSKRDLVKCHTLLPHPLFEPGKEYFSLGSKGAVERTGGMTTPLLNSVLKRELSDAEEEEEERGGASSHGNHRLEAGGVLNLLEQANISGSMNHGTLLLQPALSISRLLGFGSSHDLPRPLPETSHDLSLSFDLAEASANQPTNRSVASYLRLGRAHLGFTEGESSCAQELYDRIEEAGERGVEEVELMDRFHGDVRGGRGLQDHITALLNFEMVYRVGVAKELLVSFKHASTWMMTSDPSREDATLIAYRPWMSVDSCDPHVTFLERYEHAVLSHVVTNPGVTMVREKYNLATQEIPRIYCVLCIFVQESLVEKFSGLLHPCRLKEILTVSSRGQKYRPLDRCHTHCEVKRIKPW